MISKKILLSKDQALLEVLNGSFFQRSGFELVMLDQHQPVLKIVETEAPALTIFSLDLMGDLAISCCQRIKADPLLEKTGVLLVLPEGVSDSIVDRCWDSGCDAVVHPPLCAERLLETSCHLLKISSRLDQRMPVGFQLAFNVRPPHSHIATAVNINEGGTFIATNKLYPVDTPLAMEFTLPGYQSALHVKARVAWVNHPEWLKKNNLPCGMGVEFVGLSDVTRTVLQEFLSDLSANDVEVNKIAQ